MARSKADIDIVAHDKTRGAFNTATNNLKRFDKSIDQVGRNLKLFVGPAILGLAVKRLTDMTSQAITSADALGKLAKQTGFNVEELQKWRFAAEQAGITQGQFNSAIGAFGKRLGELRAGTGSLFTLLNKVDQAFAQQLIQTTNTEDALHLLNVRISETVNQQDRLALSAAAFGRGPGIAMVQMMQEAADTTEMWKRRLEEVGGIIPKALTDQAEDAADAMNLLGTAFSAIIDSVILQFADEIEGAATALANFIAQLRGVEALSRSALVSQIKETRLELARLKEESATGFGADAFNRLTGNTRAIEEAERKLAELTERLREIDRLNKETGSSFTTMSNQAEAAAVKMHRNWADYHDQQGRFILEGVQIHKASMEQTEADNKAALDEMQANWEKALAEVEAELDAQTQVYQDIWDNMVEGMQAAFADEIYDVLFVDGIKSFGDFADAVVELWKRMIAQMIAAWVTSGIIGLLSGAGFAGFNLGAITGPLGSVGGLGLAGLGGLGGLFGGGSTTAATATGIGAGGGAIAGTWLGGSSAPVGSAAWHATYGMAPGAAAGGGSAATAGAGAVSAVNYAVPALMALAAAVDILGAKSVSTSEMIRNELALGASAQTSTGANLFGNFDQNAPNISSKLILDAKDAAAELVAEFAKLNGYNVEFIEGLGYVIEQTEREGASVQELISAFEQLHGTGEASYEAIVAGLKRGVVAGQEFKAVVDETAEASESLASGLSGAIREAEGLANAIRSIPQPPSVPGFQFGGSFKVGGRGGTDANLVQFRASMGEVVTVETAEQARQSRSGNNRALVGEIRALRRESGVNVVRALRSISTAQAALVRN